MGIKARVNRWFWGLMITALTFVILSSVLYLMAPPALAQPVGVGAEVAQWGYIAAALATGFSSVGAGIAVSQVGSAAVAAVAEKPESLGRVLIILGLAEGIAIYGLIISFIIIAAL